MNATFITSIRMIIVALIIISIIIFYAKYMEIKEDLEIEGEEYEKINNTTNI